MLFALALIAKVILLLTCVIPLAFVICNSLRMAQWNALPFTSLLEYHAGQLHVTLDFRNYLQFFQDSLYLHSTLASLFLATACTAIAVPFGFFIAWNLYHVKHVTTEKVLYRFLLLPMFIPFVVRLHAWMMLSYQFHTHPLVPAVLMCVHTYIPMVIAIIYDKLKKLDSDLLYAAADLGASPLQCIYYIIVPLIKDSLFNSTFIIFSLGIGEYIGPAILSGGRFITLGELAQYECFLFYNIPMSAVLSLFMIIWTVLPMMILRYLFLTPTR